MKKEDIEYYATAIYFEFVRLVIQNFAGVLSVEEFLELCLQRFPNYNYSSYTEQFHVAKLEEESKMSCVSFAIIMGIWSFLVTYEEPFFLIEPVGAVAPDAVKHKSKKSAHVLVGKNEESGPLFLPTNNRKGTLFELWQDKRDPTKNYLRIVGEDDKRLPEIYGNGLIGSVDEHPSKTHVSDRPYKLIDTVVTLIANRLSTYGLNKEQRMELDKWHYLLAEFTYDYPAFLSLIFTMAHENSFYNERQSEKELNNT